LGIRNIHGHIMGLSHRLRSGLERLGARLVSPEGPDEARSGITIFRMHDSPEGDRVLLEKLLENKIYIAQRYTSGVGGLRASTHFYNNEEDVESLLNAIEELVP